MRGTAATATIGISDQMVWRLKIEPSAVIPVTGASWSAGADRMVKRSTDLRLVGHPPRTQQVDDEEDQDEPEGDARDDRRGERATWRQVLLHDVGDHPIASEISTAAVSDRSRAATTAANAAAIKVAMPAGVRPLVGATRMPANPASMVLTAQTPRAIRPGLVPDREVIASESTLART